MKKVLNVFLLLIFWHQTVFAQYRLIEGDEVQGIGSSQNLLKDAGWEKTKNLWTASSGTYARSTSSPLRGVGSATWDASATSQTLTSSAVAIPTGLYGANGVASCRFQAASGTATHTIGAYDGSNLLATRTITSVTSGSARGTVNFGFPSSGNIQIRITSAADEPSIKIDDCFLGAADTFNLSQISQATLHGANKWVGVASCTWSVSSTTYSNFSADTDCNNPTPSGNASAPGTKIPAIVFSNGLPAGDYLIIANAMFYKTGVFDTSAMFRFSDGTNTTTSNSTYVGTGNTGFGTVSGKLSYSTAQSGPLTIQMQGGTPSSASASAQVVANSADFGFEIMVYKYPTASDLAYKFDLTDWFAIADITGANPSLGVASVSSYTEIIDAGLTMTPVSGSQPMGIMCSTTNAATAPSSSATVCAAGSESIGANFNIPTVGWYEVCFDAAHRSQLDAGVIAVNAFEVIETPTNAQTITQSCGPKLSSAITGAATNQLMGYPGRYCGQCNFSSAGIKGVRLMYEQLVSGTPDSVELLADAASTVGQRVIRMTVRPMRYSMSTPLLVGSVTSASTGAMKVESAKVTPTSNVVCTVNSTSSTWISSTSPTAIGDCTLNLTGFSSTPMCTVTSEYGSGSTTYMMVPQIHSASSSSVRVWNHQLDASVAFASSVSLTNVPFYITCMGPR